MSSVSVLFPDGTVSISALPCAQTERLKKMQELVGGYIEVVPLRGKRYLVIDEDGKCKASQPNELATCLAHESGSIIPEDYIVGIAIIVSHADIA